jgi:hypothetical protein
MPRGGARPGAGRKAPDRPTEPLLTYSLTLRLTDVGYLNQLGHGNLSLGLRRLIDQARIHLVAQLTDRADGGNSPGSSPLPLDQPRGGSDPILGQEKGTTEYG